MYGFSIIRILLLLLLLRLLLRFAPLELSKELLQSIHVGDCSFALKDDLREMKSESWSISCDFGGGIPSFPMVPGRRLS